MRALNQFWPGVALLLLAVFATAAAYWPGLDGPLLLDDFGNLADVRHFLAGERSWNYVVFQNRSGPGGRPVAMASFLLDAVASGGSVWQYKLTNLLVHLACGMVLFALLRRLLARDSRLARYPWLPAFIAACWLVLPINVSSVLYVVQRMAQLSALFVLLALWAYAVARSAHLQGRAWAPWLLWLGVPALIVLAFLSKENGLLAPFLILVVEMVYFRRAPGAKRPLAVRAWIWLFALVPLLAGTVALAIAPDRFLGGYSIRDFTLWERVLTQPRVLWHYAFSALVPHGPGLGLFHDDFLVSRNLLTPWTTLVAILAWLAVMAGAWRLRLIAPAIACGLSLFLVGHGMESGILPLEIYFEHRNYLPSVGLLLAAVAAVELVFSRMQPTSAFRLAGFAAIVLLPITYLWTTHARATVWSTASSLYAQALEHNGESPRLRSFLAGAAISAGNLDEALLHISAADGSASPTEGMTHTLWRVLAYCSAKQTPPLAVYRELMERASLPITNFGMTAWEQVAQRVERGECGGAVDLRQIIAVGDRWLAHTGHPPTYQNVWRTRYYLARLYAAAGALDMAAELGNVAWKDSDRNNGVGVFLFQVSASLGRTDECKRILRSLERSEGAGNHRLDEAVRAFRHALASGALAPSRSPSQEEIP